MAIWHRTMSTAPKTPDGVKDYRFKWADWLSAGEAIANATVTPDTGITIDATALVDDSFSVLAWVSGGTHGVKYKLVCKITTDSTPARVEERSVFIEVADQ